MNQNKLPEACYCNKLGKYTVKVGDSYKEMTVFADKERYNLIGVYRGKEYAILTNSDPNYYVRGQEIGFAGQYTPWNKK